MTHTPLTVTAHLEAGIAHGAPWGIALDGLLASVLHDDAYAAGEDHEPILTVPEPPTVALPLARCDLAGGDWHWAATCAWPVDHHEERPDVRYWMSRADHRDLTTLADPLPTNISDLRGRYRSHHMPLLVTMTSAVTWHAVGDPDQILKLLAPIAAIGKKRAHGHGHVLAWTVDPTPDLDPWTAAHLHPDGTLGRPTPTACLDGHKVGLDGGDGHAGIRPPYIHPATHRPVRLPALLGG